MERLSGGVGGGEGWRGGGEGGVGVGMVVGMKSLVVQYLPVKSGK